MESREVARMIGVLSDIRRSLDANVKAGERTAKALETMNAAQRNVTDRSGSPRISILEDGVPVQLDWENPTITGTARAYKNAYGVVTIQIEVVPNDTERVNNLLQSGFVETLRLSVVKS